MVRFWEVKDNRGEARAGSYHTAPVLSSCFSGDGNMVFSGDCNKQVICWDLVSNKSNPMENGNALVCLATLDALINFQHDAPVSFVKFLADKNCLITGSWDKTLKYWDGTLFVLILARLCSCNRSHCWPCRRCEFAR